MTSSPDNVTSSTPYSGNSHVVFGNGNNLQVSHTGESMVHKNITLRNILISSHLTKNLLSISKLTMDNPVDILFSQPFFHIQDRATKQVIARGRCEDGLYVLRDGHTTLTASYGSSNKVSFELWNNRLGHTYFDVIYSLQNLGLLSVTSILPKPVSCEPCHLSKGKKVTFCFKS